MHELRRLSGDQLEAVLAFELENRAYFARSINDRGDEFYDPFPRHHDAFLAQQDAGVCAFYVLVDRVLEKAGFTVTGSCVVAGDPGLKFTLAMPHE